MKKTPKNVDQIVGNRLRAARNHAGISQEKLGAAIGLTFQQIQKYEKGTNRISASRMAEIAAVLGVKATYFLDGIEEAETNHVAGAVREFSATPHGTEIAKLWPSIVQRGSAGTVMDMIRMAAGEGNRS